LNNLFDFQFGKGAPMKLVKKISLAGLMAFAAVLGWTATISASMIIDDTFSGTNGSSLGGRMHDTTNLPGGTWSGHGTYAYTHDIQSNEARIGADIGADIPISSFGGYIKPTQLTISATFNLNSLVATDTFFARAFGLGFFSGQLVNAGSGFNLFRGITIRKNGDVALVNGTKGDATDLQSYTGTFDASIDHTLIFTIDTTSGGILSAFFDGQSRSFTTTLFSDANTAFAGFYASSNDGGPTSLAFVDQFTLQAVPEPDSVVLGIMASVGIARVVRRRK